MKPLIFSIFVIIISCNSISKTNKIDGTDIEKYNLTENEYKNIKNFLETNYHIVTKDTLVIKYEFNKSNCWDMLDTKNNEAVLKIITTRQKQIENYNNFHKNSMALHFRELGKIFNKIVLLDNSILIDQDSFLRNLIFKQKNICGNTLVLIKDGTYFIRKNDQHFDFINLSNNIN